MEVSTGKFNANSDEPPVLPTRATTSSSPRQPPLLENSSDYAAWKSRVEAYLQQVPVSEHINYLMSFLSDDAVKKVAAYGFSTTNSLHQNWKILDECFSLSVDKQQVIMQFLSRHQKPGESPIEYLDALQLIAVQAFPDLDASGRDELVRSRCVEGLAHGPLREHLLQIPPANTAEFTRTALRFITADRMSNPSEAHQHSVMTVETSQLNRSKRAASVAHFPIRRINSGGSKWTWNRRPAYNSYHGHQTKFVYCRRFGRNAWRCGHNRFRNPRRSNTNSLEAEVQTLSALNLHDDS
ncbi:unnamed protein product [Schistosoma turkestanicum]|nr:unnamed protein product [Schistosoma turkestanicum]